jgi:hypothetical protein
VNPYEQQHSHAASATTTVSCRKVAVGKKKKRVLFFWVRKKKFSFQLFRSPSIHEAGIAGDDVYEHQVIEHEFVGGATASAALDPTFRRQRRDQVSDFVKSFRPKPYILGL